VFRGSVLQVFVNGKIAYVTVARPVDEIYRIGTVEMVNDQESSGVEISEIRHRKMVEDEFNDVSFLIWAHLQNLLESDRADEYGSDSTRELIFRPGIGKENRTAFLFSPSTKITFPVEIPAEAVLDFGLGARSLGNEGKRFGDETNSFQVDLIDENDQEINLFSQVARGNLTEQWQDIRLDLSPYAGFRGRISWNWKMEPDTIPQKVLFLANPTLMSPSSLREKTPNVILYLVDSLRAERLGCYGNPANITPEIDRWAQNKIQFEACYTQAPWSLPALASLFTAYYPYTHKTFFLGDRPDLPTLAQMLRKRGYTTASFSENIVTSRLSGLDRGFDLLDFNTADTDRLQEWIKKNRFHPFFLYIHIQNPHLRYWPPKEFLPEGITAQEAKKINREYMKLTYYQSFSGNLEDLMNTRNLLQEKLGKILPDIRKLYDGEVATADYRFGRLVRMLEKFNLEDETLIILTANHGEEFAEHGELLHGRSLYNPVLEVPLILHLPGPVRHGMNINEPVGLIDVFPTILDILGQRRPNAQGTSLLPLILGSPGKQERKIFAVRNSFKMFSPDRGKKNVSMIDERWKAIYNQDPDTMELYDIINDPEERHNLASDYPNQTKAYKEMILLWLEEQKDTNQQSSINKWLDSVWK
jgi:arylsulfatase A-like enzyme